MQWSALVRTVAKYYGILAHCESLIGRNVMLISSFHFSAADFKFGQASHDLFQTLKGDRERVASPSRRDAGFTFRPNDGKNQSLYFINFITK